MGDFAGSIRKPPRVLRRGIARAYAAHCRCAGEPGFWKLKNLPYPFEFLLVAELKGSRRLR
jgi:hypothetical protein